MKERIKKFLFPPWENSVGIGNFQEPEYDALSGTAQQYYEKRDEGALWGKDEIEFEIGEEIIRSALMNDQEPLPPHFLREGYYGDDHFKYWASGLREMLFLEENAKKLGVDCKSILDVGCATGRVIRHFGSQREMEKVAGVDINRNHIEWIWHHLPKNLEAFQTTSIPHLPFEDNTFDVITAFSVFTHIEAFESSWLMELRRILRPGGMAWVTVHTENTWEQMQPDWPLWSPVADHPDASGYQMNSSELPKDRLVFRYDNRKSYTSNVFYTKQYLQKVWGRFFEIHEILPRCPDFQDVVVMTKPH